MPAICESVSECRKYCACHIRRSPPHGGQPSLGNRQYYACRAKQHRSAKNAAPTTRIISECNKYCACHARRPPPHGGQPSQGNIKYCACRTKQHLSANSIVLATRNSIGVQKILRLPRKKTAAPRRPTATNLRKVIESIMSAMRNSTGV